MRVEQLMTKQTAQCKTTDNLGLAAKLMWETDCGAVPVTDSDGIVKGMVTDRDICMACLMRDAPPSALAVSEAMSQRLYSCGPESSIAEAEKTMRKNQVRRIPVLDKAGRLAGVLSLADIARAAERERGKPTKEIGPDEVLQVLTSICEPQGQGRSV